MRRKIPLAFKRFSELIKTQGIEGVTLWYCFNVGTGEIMVNARCHCCGEAESIVFAPQCKNDVFDFQITRFIVEFVRTHLKPDSPTGKAAAKWIAANLPEAEKFPEMPPPLWEYLEGKPFGSLYEETNYKNRLLDARLRFQDNLAVIVSRHKMPIRLRP